jgi:hypothetical protein
LALAACSLLAEALAVKYDDFDNPHDDWLGFG